MGTGEDPPSVLPPLYAPWMEQLLGGPIPPESEATCAECAMLRPEGDGTRRGQYHFCAETKCCTYLPNLPNFLVGQALGDDDPAAASGQATLERRIAGGVAVTPLGVHSGAVYTLLYRHSADAAFGRSLRLHCPHYLGEGGGKCGLWRHRNSVCATWFCKYARGAVGKRFWEALLQLLRAVEDGLAYWCLAELDADVGSLRHLFPYNPLDDQPPFEPAEVDEVADPAKHRAAWGGWLGREHEFYRECGRLVGTLPWNEVASICGSRVALLARLAKAAYAELLAVELSATLRVGAFNIWDLGRDRCCLTGYSPGDSLDVPRVLLGTLPYFDGRPWTEAVAAVEEGEGIKLNRSLVRKLVDFEILVPGEGLTTPTTALRSALPRRPTEKQAGGDCRFTRKASEQPGSRSEGRGDQT